MSTLTIITEKGRLNHHYNLSSVGIGDGTFYCVVQNAEVDEFLSRFLDGDIGYPIQFDTDKVYIKTKLPCVVTVDSENDGLTAFTLRMVTES